MHKSKPEDAETDKHKKLLCKNNVLFLSHLNSTSITNMAWISVAYATLVSSQLTPSLEEEQQVTSRLWWEEHVLCAFLYIHSVFCRLCCPDFSRRPQHRPLRVLPATGHTPSNDAHCWLPPCHCRVHAGPRMSAVLAHLQHCCHELHPWGISWRNTQTPAPPESHLQPWLSPPDYWYEQHLSIYQLTSN